MKRILFLAILLFGMKAHAATITSPAQASLGRVIAPVSCSSSVENRTFIVKDLPQKYSMLSMQVELAKSTGTAVSVTMVCDANYTADSTSWANTQICNTVTAGQCTTVDASWTKSINTSISRWIWRWDMLGAPNARCTFACTGSTNAGDTLTVYARMTSN